MSSVQHRTTNYGPSGAHMAQNNPNSRQTGCVIIERYIFFLRGGGDLEAEGPSEGRGEAGRGGGVGRGGGWGGGVAGVSGRVEDKNIWVTLERGAASTR